MRALFPILLTLSVLCSSAVGNDAPRAVEELDLVRYDYSEAHLGTVVRLVFYSESKKTAGSVAQNCFQRVVELEAILSDYNPRSEVSQLCSTAIGSPHRVSDELYFVIAQAQLISAKSGGAFDITMGRQTQEWRSRSLREISEKRPASYKDLILNESQKTIALRKPLKIDLGGIGKGYIGDELMKLLKASGVKQAAVIVGGETILAQAPPGKKGWSIGIEDPEQKIIAKMELENIALSTSGDSYQFFEVDGKRHSHLIDPATQQSKMNRLNATVLSRSGIEADAWATALRVLPVEQSITLANKQPHIEALFLPHQQNTRRTKNFPKLQQP